MTNFKNVRLMAYEMYLNISLIEHAVPRMKAGWFFFFLCKLFFQAQ